MVEAAEEAAGKLAADGVDATVWDVRVVSPPDPAMLADAAAHGLVVTVEDGIRVGGAGTFLVDAMGAPWGPPPPPRRVLGVPVTYPPRASPIPSSPTSASTGPASRKSVRRVSLEVPAAEAEH